MVIGSLGDLILIHWQGFFCLVEVLGVQCALDVLVVFLYLVGGPYPQILGGLASLSCIAHLLLVFLCNLCFLLVL